MRPRSTIEQAVILRRSGCPLSFLITHCIEMINREQELLGKAYWIAVLEYL